MPQGISSAIGLGESVQQMRCGFSTENVRVIMFIVDNVDSINAITV
jgi:hypothetical protein